jgi:hypothetical protein
VWLTEDEHRNIGGALAVLRVTASRLRWRARLRGGAVLVFLAISWLSTLGAQSYGAGVAAAVVNHALALAWWWSYRRMEGAARKARRAVSLTESCVWWERMGDEEEAERQMEAVCDLTEEIDPFMR